MANESNPFSAVENTEEINYIEKCEGYTLITMSNTEQIISDFSLEKLEKILPCDKFLRVHKAFIVKTSLITEIVQIGNSYQAILENGKRVPISKRKKSVLLGNLITIK
ncbi:MAG: LytTR family DNA-binding domain-containing protein [Tenuifilum sp.]|jgi:DNA-binding LytR/AlgR family response regulator|uniref:LytTR family DNA-binding domain-containing protein n=1 Tax=Tenuifilum sp. TaxID=2760880 RepID=UPI002B5A2976|nr:LytTR family DNA-binding domain-containing protein [Tenuifilum sp.]